MNSSQQHKHFSDQAIFGDGTDVNWNSPNRSQLWLYHLHYFDTLRDSNSSLEKKNWLIQNWIENNSIRSRPGWEPYPTSLRIVNWLFHFVVGNDNQSLGQSWCISLYLQTLYLEANDERHILANHFFENIKALLFAGVYFEGADAERWLKKAEPWLVEQLVEQTLDDGGHYERSPHYHCLMLQNYLDLYNLASHNSLFFKPETILLLKKTAEAGLDYVTNIVKPDGSLPLFNDSVHNLAPSADTLIEYATLLFNYKRPESQSKIHIMEEPQSGIFGFRTEKDYLAIKCADIGPRYQPGHTHCDLLSFEWTHNGQELIVDSGVYEYSPGEMRSYVRSTAAHNTVTIDDDDQSEVWGEFRVGRRAKKLTGEIQESIGRIVFFGSFRGFHGIAGKAIHSRRVEVERSIEKSKKLTVTDEIFGRNKSRSIRSHLHFHPDISLVQAAFNKYKVQKGSLVIGKLIVDSDVHCMTNTSWYCPEFGLKQKNIVLVMLKKTKLPAKLSYCFELN